MTPPTHACRRVALALWLAASALLVVQLPVQGAAPAGPALDRGWQQLRPALPDPSLPPGGYWTADQLVATQDGFLLMATSFDGSESGPSQIGLWRSPDLIAWNRVPLDSPTLEHGDIIDHLYAVGRYEVMTGSATWVSTDEVTWRRVDNSVFQALSYGIFKAPAAVIDGGQGLIVAANAFAAADSGPVAAANLWTSADGLTWNPIPDPNGVFDGAGIMGLARRGSSLVAVGLRYGPGSSFRGAAWYSTDGSTWHAAPDHNMVFANSTVIDQVVAGDHGLLALGHQGEKDVLWRSSDGSRWHLVTNAPGPGTGSQESGSSLAGSIAGVVGAGPGFVAVGQADNASAVWTSVDGSHWRRVASDATFGGEVTFGGPSGLDTADALVEAGDSLVAVAQFSRPPAPSCSGQGQEYPSPNPGVVRSVLFRWTPEASRAAPPPRPNPRDPKSFRLRLSDVLAKHVSSLQLPGGGGYIDLCDQVALGPHLAYYTDFSMGAGHVWGLTIVTRSRKSAMVALKSAGDLSDGLLSLGYSDTSVGVKKTLRPSLRFGDGTSLLMLKVKQEYCDDGHCTPNIFWPYVAAWRQGRAAGLVIAQYRSARVLRLARQQWLHLEHLSGKRR